jgi:hypothetical protein
MSSGATATCHFPTARNKRDSWRRGYGLAKRTWLNANGKASLSDHG